MTQQERPAIPWTGPPEPPSNPLGSDGNPHGDVITIPRADKTSSMVEVDRAEYERLLIAARSWWSFWGSDAYQELLDREVAHRIRQASIAVSLGARWSLAVGPSYRELERLRSTPTWVSTCTEPWCFWQESVTDRSKWTNRCPRHRDEVAA